MLHDHVIYLLVLSAVCLLFMRSFALLFIHSFDHPFDFRII